MGKKSVVVFLILMAWLTGCSAPEATEPELTKPATENLGTAGYRIKDYGTADSGTACFDTEKPETAGPGTEDYGTADTETAHFDTEKPETVDPGTEDYGTADPETTRFGTGNPETSDAAEAANPGSADLKTAKSKTENFELADSEKSDEERKTADCKTIDSIYTFKQIYMYSEQSGWALTTENELLFTEEGIEKFFVVRKIHRINAATDGFLSASFLGGQTVYLTYFPEDDGQLAVEYTNDGGAYWQKTLLDYTGFGGTCDAGSAYLALADEKTGYLLYCSTPGAGKMTKILLETADGGRNFNVTADLSEQIAGYPQGITFHGDKGYIAVSYHGEDGYLYSTADGGLTWEDEKLVSAESIKAGEAISYIDGYPPVFSSQDSGRGMMILKMVNENTVYQIFETADGGGSWNAAGVLPCDSLSSCSPDGADGFLFLDGAGKLYAVSN